MELKTIPTTRVPVRYYEGGQGASLVFLHGAGGLDLDLDFLNTLAQRFHVYAPLVPGYGDSEECAELRDMLDFTLHTWDVGGCAARCVPPGADCTGWYLAGRLSDPGYLLAHALRAAQTFVL